MGITLPFTRTFDRTHRKRRSRFENGRIAELWDVGQEIPQDLPNEFGMF
jgi:hypothetical protein